MNVSMVVICICSNFKENETKKKIVGGVEKTIIRKKNVKQNR